MKQGDHLLLDLLTLECLFLVLGLIGNGYPEGTLQTLVGHEATHKQLNHKLLALGESFSLNQHWKEWTEFVGGRKIEIIK